MVRSLRTADSLPSDMAMGKVVHNKSAFGMDDTPRAGTSLGLASELAIEVRRSNISSNRAAGPNILTKRLPSNGIPPIAPSGYFFKLATKSGARLSFSRQWHDLRDSTELVVRRQMTKSENGVISQASLRGSRRTRYTYFSSACRAACGKELPGLSAVGAWLHTTAWN